MQSRFKKASVDRHSSFPL